MTMFTLAGAGAGSSLGPATARRLGTAGHGIEARRFAADVLDPVAPADLWLCSAGAGCRRRRAARRRRLDGGYVAQ